MKKIFKKLESEGRSRIAGPKRGELSCLSWLWNLNLTIETLWVKVGHVILNLGKLDLINWHIQITLVFVPVYE